MSGNICNFIPYKNDYNSLHTINFVYESDSVHYKNSTIHSVYKVFYICSGHGVLHHTGKKTIISAGDIFFTFPGTPFSIEYEGRLELTYISFLGNRANMIMDKLGISNSNFHFPNCEDVYPFLEQHLNLNVEISDLITESILLYIFYYLGNKLLTAKNNHAESNDLSLNIKKYIDDNYSNSDLSLELISKNLSYSPKYISSIFKKNFNISISDYITTLRIQHACTLIQQGFSSISDISSQCGYADAQYFSKIFKKRIGKTPSEYIKNPVF